MALVDDFKLRFPEFAVAVVDQRIPILAAVWPAYYGGNYDSVPTEREAILNLLAHLLTLDVGNSKSKGAGSATSGAVASKSVGNVSVSYSASNNTSDDQDFFGTTSYGRMFMMLTRNARGGVFV